MINKLNKNENRLGRKKRVNITGTTEKPRLSVYKSLAQIYAQIIDDEKQITVVSSSTLSKDLAKKLEGKSKTEAATIVGEAIAKLAIKKGIKTIVFDRAGYLYTGRVKALAEGARAAGLKF